MWRFVAALSFFTFIPAPGRRDTPALDGWALSFAPLVGFIIGGGLVGLDAALVALFPQPVRDGLLVAGWVILTGGMHLDGLADSFDGLAVSLPPERRLEILRDKHSGAFAVVGLTLTLILKVAALTFLAGRVGWLLAGPVVARMGMLLVMRIYPYARQEGLGAGLRQQLSAGPLALAALVTVGALVLASRWAGLREMLLVASVALVFCVVFGAWAARRLGGGLTGDVYGATVELSEVVILLAAGAVG